MLDKLLQWDRDIFIYLNNLGIEEYDSFWSFVTNISSWVPLYLLFFILIFYKRPKKQALVDFATVVLVFLFVLLLTNLTKDFVGRLRPSSDTTLSNLIRVVTKAHGFSFFSGHASSSFSLTTIVVLVLRDKYKWVYFAYIWPLLFCMSRIYVGVHYPLDIAVGALVGTVSAYLLYKLSKKLTKPYLV
ncbi:MULTISPECIES: phosphatase PAP2 family protein [Cellulophaga]|uniref:Phosphoesterase PA-phosphatase related protein n=2 Tax=Cellulophaga TaxID=104264 RepID=F0RAP1_CELLC|nr:MULTISPECIES: phosphatase PAP2 family protein [Cellulophaga]ADY28434.1 phosphoesterase PA-phosphatase related protein [Cellulophaga lytica DSM 7489]AIM59494.1 phosphatidic acid phosphatase [Cellulophaga lytica]APU09304.1 phosphatidic acid phosphatase [Cellulophaga lytica]EWH12864.1 phosphoesterase PA-phosphatase-like protein [Cellulophaga geojensis KL-A]MDO6854712.1 phosphatase PAP2 family protein [Cellulophaga lytica]